MAFVSPAGRVCLVLSLVLTTASFAHAQSRAEVGASLINAAVTLGDDKVSTVGIPSGGFGIVNPGAYATVFMGQRVGVEPQLGLVWMTDGDESIHLLHFAGQFDYFLLGAERSSPYVFATAGIVSVSDEDYKPKSFGGGVGYRIRAGEGLAFRIDGRYTHFTQEDDPFGGEDDGNSVAFTLSIGGLFGQ